MALILNGNQYAEIPLVRPLESGLTMFAYVRPGMVNALSSILSLSSMTLVSASVSVRVSALLGVTGFQTGSVTDIATDPVQIHNGWQKVAIRSFGGSVRVNTNSMVGEVSAIGTIQAGSSDKVIIGGAGVALGAVGQKLNGEIANVRVWSTALSDQDVEKLMNAESQGQISEVASASLIAANNFNGSGAGSIGKPDATLVNSPVIDIANPLPPVVGDRHPKTQRAVKIYGRNPL